MKLFRSHWSEIRPHIPTQRMMYTIKGSQSYSKFNREFYFPKNASDEFEKMVLPWVLVIILGVVVTLAGLFIDYGVVVTTYTVYGMSQTLILDNYRDGKIPINYVIAAYISFALSCAFFAFLSAALVVFMAPQAEGSGIPDVKSYLNGVHLRGLFSVPTAIAKAVGCCFSIGSGLIAGREGPIIHVGAILGAALSQGSSQTFQFRLPSAFVKHFRSAEWKRDFAVMGSACGVAAAFIAPMGGVLFAIEEGATVWRQQMTFLTLFACIITAFLTSVVRGYINDVTENPIIPAVLFGSYRDESPDILFRLKDFPYVFLIAIIGGIIGAIFSWAQNHLSIWRKKYIRVKKWRTLLEVVIISIMISSVRFWLPYGAGNCIDDHNVHLSQGDKNEFPHTPNSIPFNCEDNQTNDLGILFWSPVEHMLKFVLHDQENDIDSWYLVYAFIFYFVFMTLVYGIAVPSGLFIPCFVVGGCYGRLVGQLAAASTGNRNLISSYAFLGCASALGGVTRVTISVALIALESTQNFNLSLYVYMVVIVSKLIGDSFNLGIYDMTIANKDIPFLVDDLGFSGYQLTMEDVMNPVKALDNQVITDTEEHREATRSLRGSLVKRGSVSSMTSPIYMATVLDVPTVRQTLDLLDANPATPEFIVLNAEGGLAGTIERLIILRLLQCRLFGEEAKLLHPTMIDSAWPNLRNKISPMAEFELGAAIAAEYDINISVIDLRPYVDTEPAIVLSTSSMRKAHNHIRNGERHVLVAAPQSIRIVGTVRRHDILPGCLDATLVVKGEHQRMEHERELAEMGIAVSPHMHDELFNDVQNEERHMSVTSETMAELGKDVVEIKEQEPTQTRDRSGSRARRRSATLVDATIHVNMDPFEPRFYELLHEYIDARRRERARELELQEQDDEDELIEDGGSVSNSGSKTSSKNSKKNAHLMSVKPRNVEFRRLDSGKGVTSASGV
jgi:H+/Cl- antiporter ClcA